MAKIVRYNGNLVPFASSALGTERTLFGEVTQANDITSQFTADFLRGWGIVGPSDQPTLQDFNAVSYTHGQILSYLHQIGLAEYNAAQEYHIGSLCNVAGTVYKSLTNTNIGNTPSTSPTQWSQLYSPATTSDAGLVELATTAEMTAGSSTALVPPVSAVAAQLPFRGIAAYATAGTFTWVVPSGVTTVQVIVQGGGAGGGGANQAGSAAGGGAGGYTEGLMSVTPGGSITVIVGAGGAGGTTTPTNGVNGGTSSFNGSLSATGGVGGQLNLGGISTAPGASGTGSGGYLNLSGGFAGQGYQVTGGYTGGLGAAPQFGSVPVQNVATQGVAATALGGGGNGSAANAAGGNGKSGYVIIKY